MTGVVLAAFGVTAGLVGTWLAVRARRRTPSEIIRLLEPAVSRTHGGNNGGSAVPPIRTDVMEVRAEPRSKLVRRARAGMGSAVADAVRDSHWIPRELHGWLRASGSSLEHLCGEVVLGALAGIAAPLATTTLLASIAVRVPLSGTVWVGVALVAVGTTAPILELRATAERRRRAARAVLASYLDLVGLGLAGGMGVESALHAAATVATDSFTGEIADALERARHSGSTPWKGLASLGTDIGLDELVELAAAVGLAGSEGARIRSTLAAKAASIRRHALAEAETEANTLTERLFIPGTLLLLGFLLFVGYPAVARITSGF